MLTAFSWRNWMQCVANCCAAAVYSQSVYYYIWIWGKKFSLGMGNSVHFRHSADIHNYTPSNYVSTCLTVPHTKNWFRLLCSENSGKWKICAVFAWNWTRCLSCQLNYNNWTPSSPHNPAHTGGTECLSCIPCSHPVCDIKTWLGINKKAPHQDKSHAE